MPAWLGRPLVTLSLAPLILAITSQGSRSESAWQPDGTEICAAPGGQILPQFVGSNLGSTIVAWVDLRSARSIYATRLLEDGTPSPNLPQHGVALTHEAGVGQTFRVLPEGDSTFYLVYNAGLNMQGHAVGQKLRYDFTHAAGWPEPRTVSDPSASEVEVMVDAAWHVDSGLLVLTARGSQTGPQSLWLSRFRPSGDCVFRERLADSLWLLTNAQLTCAGADLISVSFVAAQSFEALVQDSFAVTTIFADSGGVLRGSAHVATVSDVTVYLRQASTAPERVVVAWQQNVGNGFDLHAATLQSDSGVVAMTAVCSAPGWQDAPSLLGDGQGGWYVAWRDNRPNASNDLYGGYFDASGAAQWEPDGRLIWSADRNWITTGPHLARLPGSGVAMTWSADVGGLLPELPDIYLTALSRAGTRPAPWPSAPIIVGSPAYRRQNPVIHVTGTGEVLLAWEQWQGTDSSDLYGTALYQDGTVSSFAVEATASVEADGVHIALRSSEVLTSVRIRRTDSSGQTRVDLQSAHGSHFDYVDATAQSPSTYDYDLTASRQDGREAKCQLRVEVSGSTSPLIIPNPTTDRVTMSNVLGMDAAYAIYDARGRGVAQGPLRRGQVLDLSLDQIGCPPGIYHLVLSAGGRRHRETLIRLK